MERKMRGGIAFMINMPRKVTVNIKIASNKVITKIVKVYMYNFLFIFCTSCRVLDFGLRCYYNIYENESQYMV